MTNTQKKKSLISSYKRCGKMVRSMKSSIEENLERGIMKKMRKGRVAKGMKRVSHGKIVKSNALKVFAKV